MAKFKISTKDGPMEVEGKPFTHEINGKKEKFFLHSDGSGRKVSHVDTGLGVGKVHPSHVRNAQSRAAHHVGGEVIRGLISTLGNHVDDAMGHKKFAAAIERARTNMDGRSLKKEETSPDAFVIALEATLDEMMGDKWRAKNLAHSIRKLSAKKQAAQGSYERNKAAVIANRKDSKPSRFQPGHYQNLLDRSEKIDTLTRKELARKKRLAAIKTRLGESTIDEIARPFGIAYHARRHQEHAKLAHAAHQAHLKADEVSRGSDDQVTQWARSVNPEEIRNSVGPGAASHVGPNASQRTGYYRRMAGLHAKQLKIHAQQHYAAAEKHRQKAGKSHLTQESADEDHKARVAAELPKWLARNQKMIDDHHAKHYPNVPAPKLSISHGKKYAKIVSTHGMHGGGSAHAFVDKETGNIHKPASWKSPAKGPRGNILDEHGGMKRMGVYGPEYNRG